MRNLDHELEDLLATARTELRPDEGRRDEIRHRVAMTVAVGAGTTALASKAAALGGASPGVASGGAAAAGAASAGTSAGVATGAAGAGAGAATAGGAGAAGAGIAAGGTALGGTALGGTAVAGTAVGGTVTVKAGLALLVAAGVGVSVATVDGGPVHPPAGGGDGSAETSVAAPEDEATGEPRLVRFPAPSEPTETFEAASPSEATGPSEEIEPSEPSETSEPEGLLVPGDTRRNAGPASMTSADDDGAPTRPRGARPVADATGSTVSARGRAEGPPKTTPASADVAREAALLSTALDALRAGHPQRALDALQKHARRYPRGALRPERETALRRVRCAMGESNFCD